MKELYEGDTRARWLFAQKLPDRAVRYRLSPYVLMEDVEGHYFLKNTFHGQVLELDGREWEALSNLREGKGSDGKKACLSWEQIEGLGFEVLVREAFLVAEGLDDYAQYRSRIEFLRKLDRQDGLAAYTIFPTTACNARCVYCFEKGFVAETMTKETADRLIGFIAETGSPKGVRFRWFGGEPLVKAGLISYICRGVAGRGVEYSSEIVTNATLLTPEMADEAVKTWHLKRAQVSLDGAAADYTARKQYINPSRHNYERAMEAIGLLKERGVKLLLRCNFDRENLPGLRGFADDLYARFGGSEDVAVEFAVLFQEYDKEDFESLHEELHPLNEYVRSLGFKAARRFGQIKSVRTYLCAAEKIGSSIVIDPKGKIYGCEHLPEGGCCGDIFTGIEDEAAVTADIGAPARDECRECCFLPICTPFYKNSCPAFTEKCRELRRLQERQLLKECLDM